MFDDLADMSLLLLILKSSIQTTALLGASGTAQWIRLCLPSCCPEFESQVHHPCFYKFTFDFLSCRIDKNKQKEDGIGPFLQPPPLLYYTYDLTCLQSVAGRLRKFRERGRAEARRPPSIRPTRNHLKGKCRLD